MANDTDTDRRLLKLEAKLDNIVDNHLLSIYNRLAGVDAQVKMLFALGLAMLGALAGLYFR